MILFKNAELNNVLICPVSCCYILELFYLCACLCLLMTFLILKNDDEWNFFSPKALGFKQKTCMFILVVCVWANDDDG